MADVNIKINGRDYTVPAGSTILTAARSAGIEYFEHYPPNKARNI